jgi:hypothetical protein
MIDGVKVKRKDGKIVREDKVSGISSDTNKPRKQRISSVVSHEKLNAVEGQVGRSERKQSVQQKPSAGVSNEMFAMFLRLNINYTTHCCLRLCQDARENCVPF